MAFIESIAPGITLEQLVPTLQRIIDYINSSQTTNIINDGGSDRYLIGYQKDGWGEGVDFGIKISQEGVDVKEAEDSQLLYKSNFSTEYFYDLTGRNYMQQGVLPDGSVGLVITKDGESVEDAFS